MTVLSHQSLHSLILGEKPMIRKLEGFTPDLVQPASIDCPLGLKAYRMRSASVPRRHESVQDILSNASYTFDLREEGSYFDRGGCFLIPLALKLALSGSFYAEFSPKSTTGRNDVFVRVLVDRWSRYDVTPRGYMGGLYLEIVPISYAVRAKPYLSLTQMRVKSESTPLVNVELEQLHARYGVVRNQQGEPLEHSELEVRQSGIFLHVDLSTPVVGFEVLDHPTQEVNLGSINVYDPREFWRPIQARNGTCVLSPGKFYLLRTKERVLIPPPLCAWLQPYDVRSGEFRSHYAGFFDNGFGGEEGTTAVLEVRVRDVPFRIYDGQPICHLVFERTDEIPEKLYGKDLGSNYTGGGPSLAKNFQDRSLVWYPEYWK